jgi:hypothetical protein
MPNTLRAAAAALIRERAPAILPSVIALATAGDARTTETFDLERRLTGYLERRTPLWLQALEADDTERPVAIRRLLRTDREAGEEMPPVVVLGTVAIGYRVIEGEIRAHASSYGHSADGLWAEVDLLRRNVLDVRRELEDGGRVA